jgi:hypothetical protein
MWFRRIIAQTMYRLIEPELTARAARAAAAAKLMQEEAKRVGRSLILPGSAMRGPPGEQSDRGAP